MIRKTTIRDKDLDEYENAVNELVKNKQEKSLKLLKAFQKQFSKICDEYLADKYTSTKFNGKLADLAYCLWSKIDDFLSE